MTFRMGIMIFTVSAHRYLLPKAKKYVREIVVVENQAWAVHILNLTIRAIIAIKIINIMHNPVIIHFVLHL